MGWLKKAFGGGGGPFGLLGGLGDPLGRKSAKKARRRNEARHNQALGLIEDHTPLISKLFSEGEDNFRSALGELDTAKGMVSQLGAASRQSIRDHQQRAMGGTVKALMGRGLGSSSQMGNMARGLAADSVRATQAVNEGVAGAHANIHRGRAGVLQALAAHNRGEAMARSDWSRFHVNTLLRRKDRGSGGWLAPVLQAAGTFVGAATGAGGLGGAGGGGAQGGVGNAGRIF